MTVRFATTDDTDELLRIYEQYIDTAITFEYTLPTHGEFENRIRDISEFYPYLVCEDNGRIVGYAYAHRLMERAAYRWDAELSIYLDANYSSGGIGTKLYRTLIDILCLQGIHNVYGIVTHPNEKSEGLHRKLGFNLIGTHHSTGFKNGRWHDVSWYEKCIAECDGAPSPIIPVWSVSKSEIEAILNKYI